MLIQDLCSPSTDYIYKTISPPSLVVSGSVYTASSPQKHKSDQKTLCSLSLAHVAFAAPLHTFVTITVRVRFGCSKNQLTTMAPAVLRGPLLNAAPVLGTRSIASIIAYRRRNTRIPYQAHVSVVATRASIARQFIHPFPEIQKHPSGFLAQQTHNPALISASRCRMTLEAAKTRKTSDAISGIHASWAPSSPISLHRASLRRGQFSPIYHV